MSKTAVRVVMILVVGAALALGAVAYQDHRRQELGRTLLSEFKDALAQFRLDPQAREYAGALADQFHADAYAQSFGADAPAMGGTTNVNAYQQSLLSAMIAQASRDGRKDLADALDEFRNAGSTLDLGAEDRGGGG
jgi:hypothetical protein